MTNAERLNDMNRPAEEEAIKFLPGKLPSYNLLPTAVNEITIDS